MNENGATFDEITARAQTKIDALHKADLPSLPDYSLGELLAGKARAVFDEIRRLAEYEHSLRRGYEEQQMCPCSLIVARNKLINDLLKLPSLSREDFEKGLRLQDELWKEDAKLNDELKEHNHE